MNALMGYNLLGDSGALDPTLTSADQLIITAVWNGIYDQLYITEDVDTPYNTNKPTGWTNDTIISVDFDGNVAGGNAGQAEVVEGVRVKRRVVGVGNPWITLTEFSVTESSQLTFVYYDYLALNGTNYEYAFVPIIGGAEGEYMTATVTTNFRGVFLADNEQIYKLFYGVQYGTSTQNQNVGVYNTLNRKYPVIISNATSNYMTGSVTGDILPADYGKRPSLDDPDYEDKMNKVIDVNEVRLRTNAIKDFLTNKKSKILKDWNNNGWLCYITGNPSIVFNNNYGMGLTTISASWTEVGDPSDRSDLYINGLIPTEE